MDGDFREIGLNGAGVNQLLPKFPSRMKYWFDSGWLPKETLFAFTKYRSWSQWNLISQGPFLPLIKKNHVTTEVWDCGVWQSWIQIPVSTG